MTDQLGKQKVALVTGANSEIGAEIAKKLSANGYRIALHVHKNSDNAKQLHTELKDAGQEVLLVKADLTEQSQVIAMFDQVNTNLGTVVTLVNVAGIDGGRVTVDKLSANTLQDVMAVNFYGAVYCIQQAIQHMEHLGGGSIVNITSQAAVFGGHQLSHYAASKAALVAFTTGAARELITKNIRINNVSPGPVENENLQHGVSGQNLPIGRLAKPSEIADAVAWLVSEQASYVSGITIPVTAAR